MMVDGKEKDSENLFNKKLDKITEKNERRRTLRSHDLISKE